MPRSIPPRPRSASRAARRGRSTLLAAIASNRAHVAGTIRVVDAANIASLGKTVVVDTHGRTLYVLHPETARHLLCRSHACLEAWPPLLVHSASVKLGAGPGVSGRLGVIRRGAGKYQVTLRGLPLYRFTGDSAKGEANGEGIKNFGSTWHALAAAAKSAGAPQAAPPAPAPPHYAY